MSPFNGLMNHVAELSCSEVFITRNISTRAATILGGIPLEVLAMLQNVILLPFQPVGAACKVVVKVFNLCINSRALRDVEDFLPGISQIFITAYKIVAYAFGTIFTATLGLLSPMANFRLHCAFSLIYDEKAEAEKMQAEQEEAKVREQHEALMQAQIQTMLFEIRQKAAEQERLKAEEAQKEKEAQAAMSKLAKADEGKKQNHLSMRFPHVNPVKDSPSISKSHEMDNSPSEDYQHPDRQLLEEVKKTSYDGSLSKVGFSNRNGIFRRIKNFFNRPLVN